jgi:RimJ/RimL family protein N-acetyltransferase
MMQLTTDRLDLIPPEISFSEDVYTYSIDPLFYSLIGAKKPESIAQSQKFVEMLINDNDTRKRCYWMIAHRLENKVIGTIGLIFAKQNYIEIGYGLSADFWGQGLFSEAATEVLNYADQTLRIAELFVRTRADNIRSIKAAEKMGFKSIKQYPDFYVQNGRYFDCVEMKRVTP